jgi:putative ABC transport system permease protein
MNNVIQDIRYAARLLRRNPGFTAVAILALALGIGANTAVFTVVNGVLLRPMPFPEPERLHLVSYARQHGPFESGPSMLDSDYLEFRRQDQIFERLATFTGNSFNLTGAGDPVHIPAANVTPDFFSVLQVIPAVGRAFLADEDQPGRDHVVLLSDKLWRNRFGGDSHILDRTVTLDGVRHTVVGVMPPGFTFPYEAEAWTPLAIKLDPHNAFMRPVIGRLKSGASREKALSELQTIVSRLPADQREGGGDRRSEIVPLKEFLVAKIRASLWIFTGAVGFVLLIACVNVANLLLARAAGRQQEIAVRIALGAGRWRLLRQLLTESMLVSLAGGAAGILLALWGVPALIAMAPEGKIPRVDQIRLDNWVFAFTVGVSLVSGMLFGLAPALQATRRELRESLSQGGGRTMTGQHQGLRSAFVISEIALVLVLLTGAGLMLKSFLRLRAVNPGFRAENVLTMTVELPDTVYQTPAQMQAFDQRTLAKLANLPGVLAAGAVNFSPLGLFLTRGDFQLDGGRRFPADYGVDKLCVSPGYFRTMGIAMRRGRDFTERDNAGSLGVVIVSQSAAKRVWPGEDPIGKRITENDHPKPEDWFTIVGVADDIRQMSLAENPDPALYYPYLQTKQPFWLSRMTFAVRTASNPVQLAAAMRGALREVDRDQPVIAMTTMQEMMAASTAEPRFQTRLLGLFSILALALAVVGIYGVLAFSVTQRTHEFGIRMALGAESADVLRIVLRRTVVLAGAGIALGTAGALAVTRVLAKFLFEVKPTDPATFLAVAALLAGVAVLAGLIPARRATRVDPMVALRYE